MNCSFLFVVCWNQNARMIRRTEKKLLWPIVARLIVSAGLMIGKTFLEAYKNEARRLMMEHVRRAAQASLNSAWAKENLHSFTAQNENNANVPIDANSVMKISEAIKILGIDTQNTPDYQRKLGIAQNDLQNLLKLHKDKANDSDSTFIAKVSDPFQQLLAEKHDAHRLQRLLMIDDQQVNDARKRFMHIMESNGFLSNTSDKSSDKHSYLREKVIMAYRLLIDPKWGR